MSNDLPPPPPGVLADGRDDVGPADRHQLGYRAGGDGLGHDDGSSNRWQLVRVDLDRVESLLTDRA
ncbi:hypothetical protein AB0C76_39400 [Kitasatospora sp. NPDC048722]|uniref:hypothetical protein n=1 Tax=Kitasatospora sp. NPDC048722 TaxID=3155639 RepID=UPI0033E37E68